MQTPETSQLMTTSDPVREARKAAIKKQFIQDNNDYVILKTKEDLENLKITKFNTWVMDGGGVYLTVKNRIGEFTARMKDKTVPGLPKLRTEQYKMTVPRVPAEIYHQIKAFFLDIADEMGNAEAYIQVYYDLEEKKYVSFVPKQVVSGASVRYDNEENLSTKNVDRYIFVLEIHSHNTMSAFFSGTDNADEKETRFYGVFGKIKDTTPEFKLRFIVHEQALIVRAEDVFDFGNSVTYPQEWKDNVKKTAQETGAASLNHSNWWGNYYGRGHGSYSWSDEEIEEYYSNKTQSSSAQTLTKDFLSKESIKDKISKNYQEGIPAHVKRYIEEWERSQPVQETDSKEELEDDGSTDTPPDDEEEETPAWLSKLTGPTPRYRGQGGRIDKLQEELEDDDRMDTEADLQEALEDLNNSSSSDLEERWSIIGDFVESMRDYDIDTLCEHLTTYGLAGDIVKGLRKAA